MIVEVCNKCLCDKIQAKEWVEINSGKVIRTCDEDADLVWCPDCEEHCKTQNFELNKK